jgi:translation initiation factor 1 (eIF-1/SUI1)
MVQKITNLLKKKGFKAEKKIRNGHFVNYDNIDEKLHEVNEWMKYLKKRVFSGN